MQPECKMNLLLEVTKKKKTENHHLRFSRIVSLLYEVSIKVKGSILTK